VPTDFAVSVTDPEIGEEVVFTVDAALVPVSWDFGSPDCGWNGPTVSCTSSPAACRNISWYFPQAGLFDVTLTTTTGTRTRTLWVRNVGVCDTCYATGAPDPAFTMTPNPVQAGTEVSFFHSEEPVVEVCEFVIDPESASYPATGGAGNVLVTTADECQWLASTDRDWIDISSDLLGSGSTIVSYAVAVNTLRARVATSIGGRMVTINQREAAAAAGS
jgi:hypothetical protein